MKRILVLLSLSLLMLPGCWKDQDKEVPTYQPATSHEPSMDEPGINHQEQPGDICMHKEGWHECGDGK